MPEPPRWRRAVPGRLRPGPDRQPDAARPRRQGRDQELAHRRLRDPPQAPLLQAACGNRVRAGPGLRAGRHGPRPVRRIGASRTAGENLKLDLVWKGADIDPAYCGPLAFSLAGAHDGPMTTLRGPAGRAGRLGGARQRWRADGQRERGRHGQNAHAWHPSRPGGRTWSGCASACWPGSAGHSPKGRTTTAHVPRVVRRIGAETRGPGRS
jgi:hypothetical protein